MTIIDRLNSIQMNDSIQNQSFKYSMYFIIPSRLCLWILDLKNKLKTNETKCNLDIGYN